MSQTIFEVLRNDHDSQRALLAEIAETHGDEPDRRELYRELKREMKAHADAEERAFYSNLLEDPKTQPQAGHSIEEHKELESMLKELDRIEYSSPAWLPLFRELRERTEHHLREEEHSMFQLAGKVLSSKEKVEVATEYQREKRVELKS